MGVGTSLKHFAANNQEINRLANDSRVSLRGYQKTKTLQAGESVEVEIIINRNDLMTYNEKAGAWKLTKGDYDLLLGFDSQTLPLKHRISITKEVLQPVSTAMAPANGEVFIKRE